MREAEIRSYRDLSVWADGMELAADCYRLTRSFPAEERFGLVSQIRRASVSVPANIAEGHGRESTQTFIQFLRVSQGSLKELETHLLLCVRVGISSQQEIEPALARCESLGKRIRALIRSLQDKTRQ